jgi:hypothetical protein
METEDNHMRSERGKSDADAVKAAVATRAFRRGSIAECHANPNDFRRRYATMITLVGDGFQPAGHAGRAIPHYDSSEIFFVPTNADEETFFDVYPGEMLFSSERDDNSLLDDEPEVLVTMVASGPEPAEGEEIDFSSRLRKRPTRLVERATKLLRTLEPDRHVQQHLSRWKVRKVRVVRVSKERRERELRVLKCDGSAALSIRRYLGKTTAPLKMAA